MAGVIAFGCHPEGNVTATKEPPVGTMMTRKDLMPDTPPPRSARLTYGSPPAIPVTVQTFRRNDDYRIDMLAHGELFDSEAYKLNSECFALSEGAGEEFNPPIPILQFPMNVDGGQWSWAGTLSSERDPHPAKATIVSKTEELTFGQSSVWTVQIDVNIKLEGSESSLPANRKLKFWFGKGYGLIKRQFGNISIREPSSP